jgi:hypothetical protein
MNQTAYSFTKLKSKNNIPKLSLFEGPLVDYELKYNKINNKYATSTINIHNNNSASKKSIEKNKRLIYSLKNFNSNIKKIMTIIISTFLHLIMKLVKKQIIV